MKLRIMWHVRIHIL